MDDYYSCKRRLIFPFLLCCFSFEAHAASDANTDLENLRRENAVLKEKVEELGQRQKNEIRRLEEKISRNAKKSKKRDSSLKRGLKAASNKLRMNGYLSAGVTLSEDNITSSKLEFTDKPNFRTDSVVGIQFAYTVTDNTKAIVQLIAQGYEDWDVDAEWAYLIYQFNDDLKFRAGRLRLPFYFESETLDVGFSYPWVRPPVEIYFLEIRSFEGVDLLYRFETGEVLHQLQVLTGSFNETILGNDVVGKDAAGIILESNYDNFTFRLAWHQLDFKTTLDIGDTTITPTDKATYSSAGIKYNDGKNLMILEASQLTGEESTFAQDTEYGLLTVGRWFGSFLPYASYVYNRSTNDNDFLGYGTCCIVTNRVHFDLPPYSADTYSLGIRYNLSAKTAIKFEVAHITGRDPRNGITDFVFSEGRPSDGLGSYAENDPDNTLGDSGTIYTLVFDMVF